MRGFGGFLILMGIGSCVLHFLGREFTLLMWISMWGDGVAWAIRGGLVLAGLGLIALGGGGDSDD